MTGFGDPSDANESRHSSWFCADRLPLHPCMIPSAAEVGNESEQSAVRGFQ